MKLKPITLAVAAAIGVGALSTAVYSNSGDAGTWVWTHKTSPFPGEE